MFHPMHDGCVIFKPILYPICMNAILCCIQGFMGVFIASFLLLRIADKLTPYALPVSMGF